MCLEGDIGFTSVLVFSGVVCVCLSAFLTSSTCFDDEHCFSRYWQKPIKTNKTRRKEISKNSCVKITLLRILYLAGKLSKELSIFFFKILPHNLVVTFCKNLISLLTVSNSIFQLYNQINRPLTLKKNLSSILEIFKLH